MSGVPLTVAVVIPVWDDYVGSLGEAVASVVDQNLATEVIVVDNASRITLPVLDGARVIRSEQRLSTGAARNLGLAPVSAPLVVFLDADDVMLPGSLTALATGICSYPDAPAFAMGMIDGDTGRRHRSPRRVARMIAAAPAVFAAANTVWSLLPTQGATIMRTHDVRACGGYANRAQGEDWVLAVSLGWRGRVRFASQPALVYRWRGDSPGRGSSAATLLANARCVRRRLREDAAVPDAVRRVMPLVAAAQLTAIVVVRPLWRAARHLVR